MLASGSVLSEIKDDELLADAIWLVWSHGKGSTYFVRRNLSIGHDRAERLIEAMEDLGVLSRPNHVGKREVSDIAKIESALCVHAKFAPLVAKIREAPDQAQESTPGLTRGGAVQEPAPAQGGGAGERVKSPSANIVTLVREAVADAARDAGKPPLKADKEFDAMANDAYSVTAEELRAFVERFERLEQEKAEIAGQMKEVMAEAKGRGYDTKVLRRIIALRKRKPDEIAEEEAVLELYKTALGMV